MHDAPLNELTDAANRAAAALHLRYTPIVVRDEAAAFRIADGVRAQAVMLGDGAFWVVCPADADRLEAAGYEWAPRR
jgi:hypothetical protein